METVVLTFEQNKAILELNRPQALNAMDMQMLTELVDALRKIKESDTSIVVIRGKGRGFSAGGDIKTMLSVDDPSQFRTVMKTIQEMIMLLYTMPKITVSFIHGPAAGLGFSFALASDYLIATNEARLAMNFIGVGLVPDGGGHFLLAQRVGTPKAKQIIWEGKTMSADEAKQLGLVDLVVDSEEQAEQWLASLQEKPLQAMIATKLLYAEQTKADLLRVLEIETDAQQRMRQTEDHREGIRAFLEKRKPVFRGK
ncbi:enoyl-CoA hydratase [Geobacillus thermodenitrificans]|jgi:2-(1,2-epoxy-1,2-dihydrophenyl)acetyl-CoA isomerase|uniref:enoyl-CoA hydratase n=1 Tax=Geobacillus thermodenitrificans TaxID=33940 RepID=UPI0034C6186B